MHQKPHLNYNNDDDDDESHYSSLVDFVQEIISKALASAYAVLGSSVPLFKSNEGAPN